MTDITSSLIGKTISFETRAPAVLGARYTDAKVLGILDPGTAVLFSDVLATHIAVYPYLPTDVLDDYTRYNYVKLELANGSVKIMGIPWISPESVQVIEATDIKVTLKGRGHEDIDLVRKALLANGFEDFVVEVVS